MLHNSQSTVEAVFQALDKTGREIRLIVFDNELHSSGLVSCRSVIHRLEERPNYAALSWVWGDPSRTLPIMLNGHRWNAPQNLARALHYLQTRKDINLLWVDALCINQSNSPGALAERGHQVRLMKEIYTNASHVTVWMGLPTSNLADFLLEYAISGRCGLTYAAESDLHRLLGHVNEILENEWWQRVWVIQEAALAANVSFQYGHEIVPFHQLIHDMRSLHDRLRAVASDMPSVRQRLIATFKVSVDIFDLFLQVTPGAPIKMPDSMPRSRSGYDNPNEILHTAPHSFSIYSDIENENLCRFTPTEEKELRKHCNHFQSVLASCRYKIASDPRDKIFGLLGLADEVVSRMIEPTYDETAARIYLLVTHQLINAQGSMSILGEAFPEIRSAEMKDLPSWVPDWAATSDMHDGWTLSASKHLHRNRFRAAGSTLARTTLTKDVLSVQGIWVDTVVFCSDELPLTKSFEQWACVVQSWETTVRRLVRYDHTSPVILDSGKQKDNTGSHSAISWGIVHRGRARRARGAAGERTIQQIIREEEEEQRGSRTNFSFNSRLHPAKTSLVLFSPPASTRLSLTPRSAPHLANSVLKNSNVLMTKAEKSPFGNYINGDSVRAAYWTTLLQGNRSPSSDPGPLFAYLQATTTHRRLFVTSDGFIGMGNNIVKPGNQIFVLAGGDVPVILESSAKQSGSMRYVGDCYVHGIMHGEAMNTSYGSLRRRRNKFQPSQKRKRVLRSTEEDLHFWEKIELA